MTSIGTNKVRAGYSWIVILLFAIAASLLTAVPVRTAEQVEVPFIAVRQWMAGQAPVLVSDLEAAAEVEGPSREDRDPFRVLAWRSDRAGVREMLYISPVRVASPFSPLAI